MRDIGTIFPSVYVMDIPGLLTQSIYATVQPTEIADLDANLAYLNSRPDTHPLLVEAVQTAVTNLQPTPVDGRYHR